MDRFRSFHKDNIHIIIHTYIVQVIIQTCAIMRTSLQRKRYLQKENQPYM